MKQSFFTIFAFGTGFAFITTLLVGAFLWYSQYTDQTTPWDSKSFSAILSDIDVWEIMQEGHATDRGQIEFTYIIENHLNKDYSTDGSSVIAMERHPDGLVASEDTIHVKYPIFIPSSQKVAVKISIWYSGGLSDDGKDTNFRKTVREKLPKLSGFVLFDKINHYQIELPKDW